MKNSWKIYRNKWEFGRKKYFKKWRTGKKEKKNEKYIDIELGKEEIDVYVKATLTKIVIEIKMSLNIMD